MRGISLGIAAIVLASVVFVYRSGGPLGRSGRDQPRNNQPDVEAASACVVLAPSPLIFKRLQFWPTTNL